MWVRARRRFHISRHLNVGPEATAATLVATTVTPMAGGEPDRYLALVGVLAILSGIVLVVAGLARFGFITRCPSGPILTGYEPDPASPSPRASSPGSSAAT